MAGGDGTRDESMDRRECLRWLGGALAAAALGPGVAERALAAEGGAEQPPAKKALKTALVCDPIYKRHDTGAGHPESPARCDAVLNALKKADLDAQLVRLAIRPATEDEIALCHDKDYIKTVKEDIASGAKKLSTGDTQVCRESFGVALAAAGGVLAAVDAVFEGTVKNAFCAVRPPGHHAARKKGMGFCLFNNVAVAARYAQTKHKVGKVLIYDWDVHHGNGTQDIFYEDGTVFYCSTHQSPWYPFTGRADETGKGKGEGCILNLPFPARSGREQIVTAVKEKLAPAADKFKPEFVLISAGFDSRKGDALGGFTLTDDDFAELTELMLGIAKKHAGGRLVSVLEGGYGSVTPEGGYRLDELGSAAAAHVRALSAG